MKLILSIAIVTLFVLAGMAQTKSDFSGRWAIEQEPAPQNGASAVGNMGSGWGSPITITQDASKLAVEYAFFVRGDMQPPLKFVYALDGSETKNSVMMGRGIQAQTSKTTWENNKLIITTDHMFENPETGQPIKMQVKRSLSLESPTSLLVETTRIGVLGGPSTTTKTIYKKN